MNPSPEPRPAGDLSLWALTAAPGLAGRVLLDQTSEVSLEALADGTTLGPNRSVLSGACVLLRTSTQMATALALLELDGLARRIVLCTPDLSLDNVLLAVAATDATVVVCDDATPERTAFERAGLRCVTSSSPATTPSDGPPDGERQTEWALFTSGTTGPPKLVAHRLRGLIGAVVRPADRAGPQGVWSTFYDIRRYGGLQILLRALVGGGSMVLSHTGEGCGMFLTRAVAAGVTFISGTPTHWRGAMLNPAAAALTAGDVRLSGEVADQAILDKLRAAFPAARVRHAFASTEAGVAFDVGDGLAGFPAEWVGASQANGVALAVTDGTLRIRSDRAASQYLGRTAERLMDDAGFVDTKDLVELRGDRYHFLGRSDGVINVGGLKVHPEEVEAVVNRHPQVEVSLAKAKRSPIIGAVVMVEVVLRAGGEGSRSTVEAEILESCRSAMEWWKVPAMIKVVPALPVSAAGKLMRSGG